MVIFLRYDFTLKARKGKVNEQIQRMIISNNPKTLPTRIPIAENMSKAQPRLVNRV